MVPPAYNLSPPQPGFMRSSFFPPLPPPPSFLFRNLRGNHLGWPPIPRIPRAQNPPIRAKKLICIRDPQTGQDITEEILSSATSSLISERSQSSPQISQPVKPPPPPNNNRRINSQMRGNPLGNFIRKTAPTQPQVILKSFQNGDYPEDEYLNGGTCWPRHTRDIFEDVIGGCSWPPANGPWMNRNNWGNCNIRPDFTNGFLKQYSRELLLSLRNHPTALIEPKGLQNWDMIKIKVNDNAVTGSASVTPSCSGGASSIPIIDSLENNQNGEKQQLNFCSKCGKNKFSKATNTNNIVIKNSPKTTNKMRKNSTNKKESTKDSKNNIKLDRGDFSIEEVSSPEK